MDIFTKYPLKTHKYLNFLDFKKAFYPEGVLELRL